jgi:hypothetical protein
LKAGDYNIGYQSRTTRRPRRQPGLGQVFGECQRYASNDAVIGVIGTFNWDAPHRDPGP